MKRTYGQAPEGNGWRTTICSVSLVAFVVGGAFLGRAFSISSTCCRGDHPEILAAREPAGARENVPYVIGRERRWVQLFRCSLRDKSIVSENLPIVEFFTVSGTCPTGVCSLGDAFSADPAPEGRRLSLVATLVKSPFYWSAWRVVWYEN